MLLSANDTPVLAAPRPVRFLVPRRAHPPPEHLERLKLTDENADTLNADIAEDRASDKESQRSSPRSTLPTEALEEFLSILRPSFFPPPSPVLFTRRPGTASLPTFQHERSGSYSFKGRGLLQQKNDLVDETEVSRSNQPSRNSRTPDADGDDFDSNTLPIRWFATTVLSSPISRMHTRNPFQRRGQVSPGPMTPVTLSPAFIPLPLPTPDELLEMS